MKSFGPSPVCCALGEVLGFCPECTPSFILTAASFPAASLCFPGMEPLSLEGVQRLVYFLLATKAPPLPTPSHWAAVFPLCLESLSSFSCHLGCLCDCSECSFTLPRLSLGTGPGTALPPPFMCSFSVARCPPSLWLLHSSPFLWEELISCSRLPLFSALKRGTDRWRRFRECGAHIRRGTRRLWWWDRWARALWNSLALFFIGPFPFFTSRKGAFGEGFCPSLYFYNPHVQWNIKCNSLTSFSQPLWPSYYDGDNIYLTWSPQSAWL